jgi:uncharacterized protein with NRDE domain
MCGLDRSAGGTWLGVNAFGVFVAVTNRSRAVVAPEPRSRGLLCLDLLTKRSAVEAAQYAETQLDSGHYAGANYVCLDAMWGAIVHGGDRIESIPITPGLHLVTNGDLDDPGDTRLAHARSRLETAAPSTIDAFLEATASVCADPRVIVRDDGRGTVSADQVVLTTDPAEAIFRHAPGPPDRTAFEDRSDDLREVLSKSEAPNSV